MNRAAFVAAEAASFQPENAQTAIGDFKPGWASTFRYSTGRGYQGHVVLSERPSHAGQGTCGAADALDFATLQNI